MTDQNTNSAVQEQPRATTRAVVVGAAVLVSFFDAGHKIHAAFAHVHAIGPADEDGNPTLSVAFPDPNADPVALTRASWQLAYRKVVGVKHVDHPDVQDGKESIAWGGDFASPEELKGGAPEIPQPEGDGSRPYFKRQVPADVPRISDGQTQLNHAQELAAITQPVATTAGAGAPAENPLSETPGESTLTPPVTGEAEVDSSAPVDVPHDATPSGHDAAPQEGVSSEEQAGDVTPPVDEAGTDQPRTN